MLIRRATKFALAAVAAVAVAGVGAPGVEAATSCTFANDVVELRMSEHGDTAGIVTESDTIAITGRDGTVRCAGGIPTTATTDTVLVVDESVNLATAAGGDGDTTVFIGEPATFGPGKTSEGFGGSSEIEFATEPRDGYDTLYTSGAGQQTLVAGNDSLSWTSDDDADVVGMPFDEVLMNGSDDYDRISGQVAAAPARRCRARAPLSSTGRAVGTICWAATFPADYRITGDLGDDIIWVGGGDDELFGGPDGDSRDTLAELENATGYHGPDRLSGTDGANVLDGGDGNSDDVLEGRGGADNLRGRGGSDTVSYAQAPGPMTVALARTTQVTAGDRLNAIEDVVGSPFGDTLTGNTAANRISAGTGADTVASGDGADRVEVRDGEGDRVSCSADADTAVSHRRSLDALEADCETVDALPEPAGPTPTPDPGKPTRASRRSRATRRGRATRPRPTRR